MEIRLAASEDISMICSADHHVARRELSSLIGLSRVYIAEMDGKFAGWLRYNLFWDNTPFMNMLYVLEPFRDRGVGRALTAHWETQMHAQGYDTVMTSTASDECAQHFYHKLGYQTVGGFMPKDGPYEVILSKNL